MDEAHRLLSPADAAELLGVSIDDVLELVGSGEIPGTTVAGRTRIPARSLEAWIDDRLEAGRRAALWNESQTASVADLFGRR